MAATFVCASRNRDLCIWVECSTKEWRICICNSFLQPRSPLLFASANQSACILSDSHGLAFVGEYWLQSTLFRASFAASMTNFGGLYPLVSSWLAPTLHFHKPSGARTHKKPCPMFTVVSCVSCRALYKEVLSTPIGCFGEAAAASLTIDLGLES